MKFKISTFIILLIIINFIAITYAFLNLNTDSKARCVAMYDIQLTKYNDHIDEIIRGVVADHIFKKLLISKYNTSISQNSIYLNWRVKLYNKDIEKCSELKNIVIDDTKLLNDKIVLSLKGFYNDIIANDTEEPERSKLKSIIKNRDSFVHLAEREIKIEDEDTTQAELFSFFSKLIFFDLIYLFLLYLTFILLNKFSLSIFKK